jgi:hypothetical protein
MWQILPANSATECMQVRLRCTHSDHKLTHVVRSGLLRGQPRSTNYSVHSENLLFRKMLKSQHSELVLHFPAGCTIWKVHIIKFWNYPLGHLKSSFYQLQKCERKMYLNNWFTSFTNPHP